MKRKLFSYTAWIGFLSLVLFLTLATFAQAQTIVAFTGQVKFNLKLVTHAHPKNQPQNHVLVVSQETFEGTMSLSWDIDPGVNNPVIGPNGCIIQLLGNDGTNICFTELVGTGSDAQTKTGWKGNPLLIATGTIDMTFQTFAVTGISYMNAKGSMVMDSDKIPTSIKIGGAINGGFTSDDTGSYIFSGTVPATTLTAP